MNDPLNWQQLASSNIDAMRYDPETQVLQIRFKSGQTYDYNGVPQAIADGLAAAASPGSFFAQNIKSNY